MATELVPLTALLSEIIDNRGRTCPTVATGIPLIATNCIKNDTLYPTYENVRHVSRESYECWFRGHPIPGDLIFVTKGSPGSVCIAPDPVDFCIAQDMVALRPNPTTVYPKYLFAILRSRETQLQIVNLHVGSLIPHFKKGDFDKLRLPIPDPSLQRYIGDLYYDITELIHRNRRMNETLEQVVRALMKSWFVDFDPVQDSEAHRTPFGVDEATCTLFPSGFEDTRRGKMPRGWTIASVSKVANVNSLSLSAKDKLDTIEYVEISEVSRGEIGNMPLYDRGTEPSRARRRLRHGDTALSTVRPDRGAYFLCLDPPINRLASTGFAVVSPIDVPWTFLYLALTTDEVSEYLGRVADGGAYPAVNPSVISDIEFVLPNKPVLDAFHTIAKPFLQLVEANRLENRTLRQLRDTLLPKLISGEVRIRDAENLVNSTINPKEAA